MSTATIAAPNSALSTHEIALAAKHASRLLAPLDEAARDAALEAMAKALEASSADLMAANAKDMQAAETASGEDKLPPATLSRLKLTPAKLREMVEQVRSVAALPDPLGRTLDAVELDDKDAAGAKNAAHGLHLEKISVPLGVLAVIFEARPDAVTQIAALALKSGNAVILKPGSEVERTAAALVEVLSEALAKCGLPQDAVSLVKGRKRVQELLGAHDLIDMIIPRGSKALVEYVQANTRIPVLGHAEGVCHIYVDRAADQELALRVIDDAKTDYPASCNAVETVLVHHEIAPKFLLKLAHHMHDRKVTMHGDAATRKILLGAGHKEIAAVPDWHTEYGDLAISIGIVDSLDAAIEHIHAHGSLHTESIITEDTAIAERFLCEVDAASLMHNASTRFADGFRYGFGAEVGISTSKFHARGPVGLEGLTTYKYLVRGHGHIAGDYRGAKARAFTHRRSAQARG
jgi:glutamate-5-semialdehyde dehydrogenase